ncbi:MAG: hypothetical protein JNL05_01930 [Flavobacteriales bacterium]|nr:hypothetical protein [Flavobacteriales bacterium]
MTAALTRVPLLLMLLALGVTILQPNIDWTEELVSCESAKSCEEGCEEQGAGDTFVSWTHPAVRHIGQHRGCARCAMPAFDLPVGATQEVVIPPPERGR